MHILACVWSQILNIATLDRQKEDPTQMVAKQQAASQSLPPPSAEFSMFQCPLCKDYLKDAVIIPCCQLSFCDACIRDKLVPEGNFQCPNCRASPISPDTLIPNRCVWIIKAAWTETRLPRQVVCRGMTCVLHCVFFTEPHDQIHELHNGALVSMLFPMENAAVSLRLPRQLPRATAFFSISEPDKSDLTA